MSFTKKIIIYTLIFVFLFAFLESALALDTPIGVGEYEPGIGVGTVDPAPGAAGAGLGGVVGPYVPETPGGVEKTTSPTETEFDFTKCVAEKEKEINIIPPLKGLLANMLCWIDKTIIDLLKFLGKLSAELIF